MMPLQKIVVVMGLFFLVTLLFPPFQNIHPAGGARNVGYSFILSPPVEGAKIDATVLLIEWLGVILIGASCTLFICLPRLKKHY